GHLAGWPGTKCASCPIANWFADDWGPTTFNDARFTNMTARPKPPCTAQSIECYEDHDTQAREGLRGASVRASGGRDVLKLGKDSDASLFTITDSFFKTWGSVNDPNDQGDDDHADAIQDPFSPHGSAQLRITRSTFVGDEYDPNAGQLPASGIQIGDEFLLSELTLDHVYFQGGGFIINTPVSFGNMRVKMNNVCFAHGAFHLILVYGYATVTVEGFQNVYENCEIVNGQVITGTPINLSDVVMVGTQ